MHELTATSAIYCDDLDNLSNDDKSINLVKNQETDTTEPEMSINEPVEQNTEENSTIDNNEMQRFVETESKLHQMWMKNRRWILCVIIVLLIAIAVALLYNLLTGSYEGQVGMGRNELDLNLETSDVDFSVVNAMEATEQNNLT